MKKIILLSVIASAIYFENEIAQAQSVGINSLGVPPNASAMLDVDAAPGNNKGLLIPRLPLVQTSLPNPVTTPATSLLVYNTATVNDVTPGYYYWDGTKWVRMLNQAWLLNGNTLTGTLPASPNEWIGTINNADWVVKTNNTEKMRVTSTGNVGIGTPNPVALLEVDKTFLAVKNPNADYFLRTIGGQDGTSNASLDLGGGTSNNGNLDIKARGSAGHLAFWTGGTNQNVSSNERVRIDFNGNVGINTTAPGRKLDVFGNAGITSSASGGLDQLVFDATAYAGGNMWLIGGGDNVNGWGAGNDFAIYNLSNVYPVGFVPFAVAPSGNVGIGLSTPACGLHVLGPNTGLTQSNVGGAVLRVDDGFPRTIIECHGQISGSPLADNNLSALTVYSVSGTGRAITTAGTIAVGVDAGNNSIITNGQVGIGMSTPNYSLDVNGTANCTANAWTSDVRKKKNIQSLSLSALDVIKKIRPVTFEWKKTTDAGMKGTQMGFIAQELEEVLPTMVLTASDSLKSKSVKYNELFPVMVKAMQEQQQMIDELKKSNSELKASNENLKSEVEKIKMQSSSEAKK